MTASSVRQVIKIFVNLITMFQVGRNAAPDRPEDAMAPPSNR